MQQFVVFAYYLHDGSAATQGDVFSKTNAAYRALTATQQGELLAYLQQLETPVNDVLSAFGSVWKYRDTGVTPPANWTAGSYDDSAWSAGPARLGYGGDGEVTTGRSSATGSWPDSVHGVEHGVKLKEILEPLGVECHLIPIHH